MPAALARVQSSEAGLSPWLRDGALAQLGERLLCKHQVIGSIPIGSTTANERERGQRCTARHKLYIPRDEESEIRRVSDGTEALTGFLFDIVNGFLKSMP